MPPRTRSARTATAPTSIGGRRWCVVPRLGGTVALDKPAVAEVKPHSSDGLREGLCQLRRPASADRPDGLRFLLAYLPYNVRRGKAEGVRVFAIGFSDIAHVPTSVAGLRGASWADLGTVTLPPTVPFPPVVHAGFFGHAVEPLVRLKYGRRLVWPAGRSLVPGTGGHRPGPDARNTELAEFTAALAHELNDLMLAELAAELGAGSFVPAG
jgi:hypothetical protein